MKRVTIDLEKVIEVLRKSGHIMGDGTQPGHSIGYFGLIDLIFNDNTTPIVSEDIKGDPNKKEWIHGN